MHEIWLESISPLAWMPSHSLVEPRKAAEHHDAAKVPRSSKFPWFTYPHTLGIQVIPVLGDPTQVDRPAFQGILLVTNK